ncbi:MAG: lipopolysaccharide core heptose(I) kinase RfaP [Phycisphaerae bacterium]|nr:lipopolysaccharide core heptose(I) kinase RfaP [Phycisphaerae bacterium]
MNIVELHEPLKTHWAGKDPFDQAAALEGQVFRAVKNRRTLRFELDGKGYFAKIHTGVGWAEIVKNLLMLKRPIVGAGNEFQAIRRLETLKIETMHIVGFGQCGRNPARLESFLITEELNDVISLEDFCQDWQTTPPPFALKKALIEKLAAIARTMHTHGVNHRDCYICHFMLDVASGTPTNADAVKLSVIDLHRAQVRSRTPRRWVVKDVAGLWFSAMDIGLTRRDRLRFMRAYAQMPLRSIFESQYRFWRQVDRTARRLYKKDFGRPPRKQI